MMPIVLSYFTKGTWYEKEAEGLRASCEKWQLPYLIEGIDPFGPWFVHAAYKASYLLQKIKELKKPVLWVDADAEFVQYPSFFEKIEADFSLRVYPTIPFSHPSHFLTGTVYFDYNPRVLQLLQAWEAECQREVAICPEGKEIWDQMVLKNIYGEEPQKWKLVPLPPGYAAIFDEEGLERVIVHYQASRLYKRFINGGTAPFGFLDHLTLQELRALRPSIKN